MLRQSEHFGRYRAALAAIREQGLAYPCFCTRADIRREIEAAGAAPHGPSNGLPGSPAGSGRRPALSRHLPRPGCRGAAGADRPRRSPCLAAGYDGGLGAVRRIDLAGRTGRRGNGRSGPVRRCRARPQGHPDELPSRRHGWTMPGRASPWSCAAPTCSPPPMSTGCSRRSSACLRRPMFHHPLLLDAGGKRFAKRDRSLTIRALREKGLSPAEVVEMAEGWGVQPGFRQFVGEGFKPSPTPGNKLFVTCPQTCYRNRRSEAVIESWPRRSGLAVCAGSLPQREI